MSYNIYYLDDEETLCELFEDFLASDNIKITTFVDAEEAIKVTNEFPPDIIFIDYRLIGITGDEVAGRIPESIPKILVTGELAVKTKNKFYNIVNKPFSFNEIETLIDEIQHGA